MSGDLAMIAERRGGLAAALGLLVLEEPGAGVAGLVAGIGELAPLASGDPAIATEYERVFLRGVPLYESVFRSDDGQHGGDVVASVVATYERLGIGEHRDQRWRIAGPDHLGLQLRCLAHLCDQEAAAWRAGTPDRAMEAVEAERAVLADHLACWAPVALEAALRCAGSSVYAPVFRAIADHLAEEFERLRPAPDLGGEIAVEPLPPSLGPARLSRLVLAPATSGTWMDTALIGRAARSIGVPWRPSDTRSSLRHVFAGAEQTGDLAVVLEPIGNALDGAVAAHRRDAERSPGNAANALRWARTAEQLRDRIADIAAHGLDRTRRALHRETLTISGPDSDQLADAVDALIADLRRSGLNVQRHADLDHDLTEVGS